MKKKKEDPKYWRSKFSRLELAQIGMIALIDEATGYQEKRGKDDLQQMLEASTRDKKKDS